MPWVSSERDSSSSFRSETRNSSSFLPTVVSVAMLVWCCCPIVSLTWADSIFPSIGHTHAREMHTHTHTNARAQIELCIEWIERVGQVTASQSGAECDHFNDYVYCLSYGACSGLIVATLLNGTISVVLSCRTNQNGVCRVVFVCI